MPSSPLKALPRSSFVRPWAVTLCAVTLGLPLLLFLSASGIAALDVFVELGVGGCDDAVSSVFEVLVLIVLEEGAVTAALDGVVVEVIGADRVTELTLFRLRFLVFDATGTSCSLSSSVRL